MHASQTIHLLKISTKHILGIFLVWQTPLYSIGIKVTTTAITEIDVLVLAQINIA